MDFEGLWQLHKRFILKVAGGALAFLVLLGVRSSIATGADRLARQNAQAQARVLDAASRLEGAEGLEKGRTAALAEELEPALLRELTWTLGDEYVLPPGEKSPALYYTTSLSKALSAVERHAARWNARVPRGASELGLQEQVDERVVDEALARLDVVRQLVTKLLDAGVRIVDSVRPGDAEYRPRRSDERALRVLPVRVVFRATTTHLAAVLAALQVEGSFLEVRACRLSRAGEAADSTLEVGALNLVDRVPEGARTEAKPEGGSSGLRRVRRFGRER